MISNVVRMLGAILALMLPYSPSVGLPRSVYEDHQFTSDIVVIAKSGNRRNAVGVFGLPIAFYEFQTLAVLKGSLDDKFEVLIESESLEWSARCCKKNKIFLLYLVKTDRGLELIRGRDGVFIIEKSR